MKPKRQAVIAGGGIAGLTTAIVLCQKNWQVTVIEQAAEFSEVGAGLQLSPNGVVLLEGLGVMPLLEDTLFEPEAVEMRYGSSGNRIFSLPLRQAAVQRWGARYINVYRPDLVTALLTRLDVFLDNGQLQLINGQRVTGYRQSPQQLEVLVDTGETRNADLLVGADGIQSTIRQQMHGNTAPRFTGNVAWRAVVPLAATGVHSPPPTACIWTGAGKHAVTTRVRSGNWVNFVGVVEQDSWREEGWRIRGTTEQALDDFNDWSPTVTQCIKSATELYRWALYDRLPLSHWSDGRVVLLGDAAHPMLPSMAQGAVQSIEDACTLGNLLSPESLNTNDVAEACGQLFARRISRTSRVQKVSAKNMKLFHTRGRIMQKARFEPARIAGYLAPWALYGMNDWLYGERF